tara:strand:- start:58 stop:1824 length:1767 start_codon:yes stop_codon:yes gene_type:complete
MGYSCNNNLAFNASHNACVAYVKDGKLNLVLEEERLSHKKHDNQPYLSICESSKFIDAGFGFVLGAALHHSDQEELKQKDHYKLPDEVIDTCVQLARKSLKIDNVLFQDCSSEHHLFHAAIGFYNSGFEDATCVIVDGAGAYVDDCSHEVETIYKASYPANFETLHKKVVPWYTLKDNFPKENIKPPTCSEPTTGIGMVYSGVSHYFGWGNLGCGTLMGLAPWGEEDPNIKPFVVDGIIDESLWERTDCGVQLIPYDYIKNAAVFKSIKNPRKKFQYLCNLAYRLQKDFESYMINLIKKAIELGDSKNIVLSGGCALNCVANYEYLKHLPEGYKLYVEPISTDAGTAAGMALYNYYTISNSHEINPLKSLYLGPPREYYAPSDSYFAEVSDVIDVIQKGKAVALFQGRSEQGPRALGNRSLLFDPTITDARLQVNKIKQREYFRPFAATVLAEHVHEWFDLRGMDDTPFMMYAVNVLEHQRDKISGVIHVDGTCRIQTVTKEQNENYYNLINEFYHRTGIPMLFNTSLNLSGDTMAETIKDAEYIIDNSAVDYLYLPDHSRMIHRQDNKNKHKRGYADNSIYKGDTSV